MIRIAPRTPNAGSSLVWSGNRLKSVVFVAVEVAGFSVGVGNGVMTLLGGIVVTTGMK